MMRNLKIPPELKGLKFADRLQSSENLDVDIIIGNDYYGQLITGKIIKTENEALIAIESKLMAPIRTRSKREQPGKRLKHTVSKDRNHASRRVTTRQPINQVLGNQQTTRRK